MTSTSRHKGNAAEKDGAFNWKQSAQGMSWQRGMCQAMEDFPRSTGIPWRALERNEGSMFRHLGQTGAGRRERREGMWTFPGSAAPSCLQLGAEFLPEQFCSYFRLERPNSFSSGLSSEILQVTEQLLSSRSARPQGAGLWDRKEENPAWWGIPGRRRCHFPSSWGVELSVDLRLGPAFPCASFDGTNWAGELQGDPGTPVEGRDEMGAQNKS